jgi:hypothetical protein
LAKRILFSTETANHRSINEYICADGLKSCQLVLVVTNLKQGSIWNTTPGLRIDTGGYKVPILATDTTEAKAPKLKQISLLSF